MSRRVRELARYLPGLPRASGDEPWLNMSFAHFDEVCPARAGMSPTEAPNGQALAGLPRASGDEPDQSRRNFQYNWSAPRERG